MPVTVNGTTEDGTTNTGYINKYVYESDNYKSIEDIPLDLLNGVCHGISDQDGVNTGLNWHTDWG